jgi:hypothetical protein
MDQRQAGQQRRQIAAGRIAVGGRLDGASTHQEGGNQRGDQQRSGGAEGKADTKGIEQSTEAGADHHRGLPGGRGPGDAAGQIVLRHQAWHDGAGGRIGNGAGQAENESNGENGDHRHFVQRGNEQ